MVPSSSAVPTDAVPTDNGAHVEPHTDAQVDAVVIGAGPVGLFQVFELGLLGIHSHVIDSLPVAGGQCIELYADKPIYDIPGTPVCTGRELIASLQKQIAPFKPTFHLAQQVEVLQKQSDGRFLVQTSRGVRLLARVVVIAGGVGSFQPRRLKIDGLSAFEASQVHYRLPDDPATLQQQRLVVIGDDERALLAAIELAESRAPGDGSLVLVHRRDEFRASPATVSRLAALRESHHIVFIAAQANGIEHDGHRLQALQVLTAEGVQRRLALDHLIAMTGLSPKLGPIADWGLALERKQLAVDTARFETSEAGIFAVGDVNTYRGKKKLILCGFHEAALAAYAAAEHVFPEKPILLEYTTTSARLHEALGVMHKGAHESAHKPAQSTAPDTAQDTAQ